MLGVRKSLVWVATALLIGCGAHQPVEPVDDSESSQVRRLEREPATELDLAMPPGSRQIEEGYWLGALFSEEHVPAMEALGIQVVLSAVDPSDETIEALERAGIERIRIPMSNRFRHADTILGVAEQFPEESIFIHCRHGADRTGAITAFLLVTRHRWNQADALYSVLYPTQSDVDGLVEVFERYGIEDVRGPQDPSVGIYSISRNGGSGGLKVRNERYMELVETTLDAMLAFAD